MLLDIWTSGSRAEWAARQPVDASLCSLTPLPARRCHVVPPLPMKQLAASTPLHGQDDMDQACLCACVCVCVENTHGCCSSIRINDSEVLQRCGATG